MIEVKIDKMIKMGDSGGTNIAKVDLTFCITKTTKFS